MTSTKVKQMEFYESDSEKKTLDFREIKIRTKIIRKNGVFHAGQQLVTIESSNERFQALGGFFFTSHVMLRSSQFG